MRLRAMQSQLRDLVRRIPAGYIKTKPGGFQADYVSHADIQQVLLAKLDRKSVV